MKNISLVLISGLAFAATSSRALEYGQSVNANGPAAPVGNGAGIYFGSGNANGSWTVDREGNIELGLRAKVRNPPSNTFNNNGTDNVYSFTESTVVTAENPANRASWNYEFSINADYDGSGPGTGGISDYQFTLFLDSDPGAGHSWSSFDPTLIPDNKPDGSSIIEQNSENPLFALVGIPGYVKGTVGTYDFILQANDKNSGDVVAQTAIRVNVNGGTASGPFNAPDGGATGLLALMSFASLAFFRRKSRS